MADMIETVKNMPAKNKGILLAVLALVITSIILLSSWLQKADYQILYSNLSDNDAGSIIQKLNEQKIPYEVSAGGIMVPSDRVYELRLYLAGQGLPQGGSVGFELFDETNFTMTDFVQKLNYRRALQGELARTIRSLSEVEQCRVHLAVPEKSLFVTEEERPKASVFLKVKKGRNLSQGQVQGVVHLISSSVEGLAPEDVTVVDSRGKMLTSSSDEIAGITSSQMEYQRNLEKDMENRAVSMLEPVVGRDKVRAKVAAAIDFTKIEKTEERFDPDSQVVRSEQVNTEKSRDGTKGGIPGVSSNLPGERPKQAASSQRRSEKKSETLNYEISKVTSHIINASGEIKRLSVVVLVDGTYTAKQGSDEKIYTARTDDELSQFEEIVKRAVGFRADRADEVSVVNMPFEVVSPEELPEPERDIMPVVIVVAKYLVPLLAVILLLLFVVRPLISSLTTLSGSQQLQLPLPRTVAELEKAMEASEIPEKDRMIEWARKNPRDATNLIQSWIEER